jgi:hypothetical protein
LQNPARARIYDCMVVPLSTFDGWTRGPLSNTGQWPMAKRGLLPSLDHLLLLRKSLSDDVAY